MHIEFWSEYMQIRDYFEIVGIDGRMLDEMLNE
jgi:hypothetical protein